MNDVTIGITAWLRYEERWTYLRRTIQALRDRLVGAEQAKWLVAAEREASLHADDLEKFCRDCGINLVWHEGIADIGENLNLLVRTTGTRHLLYVQDDWELRRDFDIGPDLELLENGRFDVVRYAWWTTPDRAATLIPFEHGGTTYWPLDPTHLPAYPAYFSHNPYLARCHVYDKVGPFIRNGRDKGFAFGEEDYDLRVRAAGIKVVGRGPSWSKWLDHFDHLGLMSSMTEKWEIANQSCNDK